MKKRIIPLRIKLIISFLLFFLLIIGTSIYINLAYKLSSIYFEKLLDQNQKLETLADRLQALLFYTETYLSQGLTKDLNALWEEYHKINDLNLQIGEEYQDLSQIINTILEQTKLTILAKQNGNNYYQYHTLLSKNISLGQEFIVKIIYENNSKGNQKFTLGKKYLKEIERKGIFLAVLTGLLSILVLIYFSVNITYPLNMIIKNARKIANGKFNVPPITVKTNDELKLIALAFNEMTRDIKKLFTELNEKIGLERELQQEKLENLKINNLLREAELKQLQSQINPHFLYNTLNTISQVAILEEADQTGDLIKKIATLLRYNLKQANTFIPLKDEIENIKIYCHIMEVRYGERVKFSLSYPENIEDHYLPSMLIQPLIENAFIHGIEEMDDKQGIIDINISITNQNYLLIKVTDNGKGIPQEKINKLLSDDSNQVSGLRNIKERLELYFKRDDLFKINSKQRHYTEITLKIPPIKEEI